jgi:hypothetical protein
MSPKAAAKVAKAASKTDKKEAKAEPKKGKAAKAAAEEAPAAPVEVSAEDREELEEQAEEAAASSGSGNAAALAAAAAGNTEMSASFKNFRHHPDMENFYRFIFENDLRHEALAIIDVMQSQKATRKQVKGAKASAHLGRLDSIEPRLFCRKAFIFKSF